MSEILNDSGIIADASFVLYADMARAQYKENDTYIYSVPIDRNSWELLYASDKAFIIPDTGTKAVYLENDAVQLVGASVYAFGAQPDYNEDEHKAPIPGIKAYLWATDKDEAIADTPNICVVFKTPYCSDDECMAAGAWVRAAHEYNGRIYVVPRGKTGDWSFGELVDQTAGSNPELGIMVEIFPPPVIQEGDQQ